MNETYRTINGEELPIPPLADLRKTDWEDGDPFDYGRYAPVEAWWINANHPGFGVDPEHTADCMRLAGFTESEIADVVAELNEEMADQLKQWNIYHPGADR